MINKILFSAILLLSLNISFSQSDLWISTKTNKQLMVESKKVGLPSKYSLVTLNTMQFNQQLAKLPAFGEIQIGIKPVLVTMPLPNGKTIETQISLSPIWEGGSNPMIPNVKTYALTNPVTHANAGRITVAPQGISGIIFSGNSNIYIAPYAKGTFGQHIVYDAMDEPANIVTPCGVSDKDEEVPEIVSQNTPHPKYALFGTFPNDVTLRTYRIAVSATGEYTTWAGSVANALTYIAITINNVQAIYDRDATIHFTLVNSPSTIFTDSLTDPFPSVSFPTSAVLSANIAALNSIVGSANYDLGAVFNSEWSGGLANVGVVCTNTRKGGASMGSTSGIGANPIPGPQGSGMDKTTAHEIGHLFNARHTMSSSTGRCFGNVTASTAWETGGGSTIMAYAGVCTGTAYQNNSDGYFHGGSIQQIKTYAISKGTCAVQTNSGNTAPLITIPKTSYTIPLGTPFVLSGKATDADGDVVTYNWEQMDANFVTDVQPISTNKTGPLFRSYPPTSTGNTRTFPSLQYILLDTIYAYEVLPTVGRPLNFRLTARDNAAIGGATDNADVAITVDSTSGPFAVTSQSSATTWLADGANTAVITWNVASTNNAPVQCAKVNILFSTDGGHTFPYTLASQVPNNGIDTVLIPSLPTYNGRIKIEAADNIFFQISVGTITVLSSCAAEGAVITPSDSVNVCLGSPSLKLALSPAFSKQLVLSGTLSLSNPVASLTVLDTNKTSCRQSSNSFRYNTFPFVVNKTGTYTFTRPSGNSGKMFNLYEGVYNPKSTCAGFITSNGVFTGNAISSNSSIKANLVAGSSYTLVVGTFSATSPTLPSSYTFIVTPPLGGKVYGGANLYINPGVGYGYKYVVVNNADNTIKSIVDSTDFRDSIAYPSGSYTVYGFSFNASIQDSLPSYVGLNISKLISQLQNNAGAFCGNLSKNSVTVNITAPTPPNILVAKSTKICLGDSILLTSSIKTGNQWYKDSVAIVGANSKTYTTSAAGSYRVAVTTGGICVAVSDPTIVIVNPLPAIPTISVAKNVLTSSYTTGNQWYRNDTLIKSATRVSYTVPTPITYAQCYKVKETNSNGCASFSDTVCFYSSTLPIKLLDFVATQDAGMVTLIWKTAIVSAGQFVIERSANRTSFTAIGTLAIQESNTLTTFTFQDKNALEQTTYYYRIKVVGNDGNITYTNIVSVAINTQNNSITLFPNPAKKFVYITGNTLKEIQISDARGKLVSHLSVIGSKVTAPLTHLASGIYMVSCTKKDGSVMTKKLIVE